MAGRKRYSVVRDPVHGDIYLTHAELRLLDTPEMRAAFDSIFVYDVNDDRWCVAIEGV